MIKNNFSRTLKYKFDSEWANRNKERDVLLVETEKLKVPTLLRIWCKRNDIILETVSNILHYRRTKEEGKARKKMEIYIYIYISDGQVERDIPVIKRSRW